MFTQTRCHLLAENCTHHMCSPDAAAVAAAAVGASAAEAVAPHVANERSACGKIHC